MSHRIIFACLSMGIATALAALIASSGSFDAESETGVSIRRQQTPTVLLESEVPRDRSCVQLFDVTATGGKAREFELRHPSCGCLSFQLDDEPLQLNERFRLGDGTSSTIRMTSTFPRHCFL